MCVYIHICIMLDLLSEEQSDIDPSLAGGSGGDRSRVLYNKNANNVMM